MTSRMKLLAVLSVIVSAIWATVSTWGSDDVQTFTLAFTVFLACFATAFIMWLGIRGEE